MQELTTDVVILGAGTAGLNARREVERAGKDWLLVEPGPGGTTCARVGCMPSKLLIAAAEAAWSARHAEAFGVRVAGVEVDGRAVLERVRRERDRFTGFVHAGVDRLPADRRIPGRGRLQGPTTVLVDDHTTIQAGAVVIATGSAPWVPPGFEAVAELVHTTDTIFELPDLPRRMAVIGAGIIGLELGQAFARLGVEVVVVEAADGVMGIADAAVAGPAEALIRRDLELHLGIRPQPAERDGDAARVVWEDTDGARHTRTVDLVLVATGRRPNLAGLGLDTLGVPLDRRGMPPIDADTLQIADLPVFVAGDAEPRRPLLHEASDEGAIAGCNAARFPVIHRGRRRVPLAIAFTEPQLGTVGERIDPAEHPELAVGEVSYADQGRARVMARGEGLARLYADRATGRLVGATILAPHAEHLAHLVAWAVADGLTVTEALERPFYHPVLEEGLRTALRRLLKELGAEHMAPPQTCVDCPGE
ncbi:MAG: dihydrolipoyl dehydrogenase [Alphaproteobacteria bacterium]|nr:dihydrolipoyl dehydrogenase [Alphaproteobacteria bacterium]